MSSAEGSIVWNSSTNFQATFLVKGIEVTYSGSIDKSLPDFSVNEATATYKNAGKDFNGTVAWHGVIGDKTLKIELDSGVVFEGKLNQPISVANTVNGSGSWTSKSTED